MPDSIKEELAAAQTANAAANPAAAAASTAPGSVPSAPAYADPARTQAINAMYDANVNAQKANLQAAYDQNLSNLEANREGIAQRYQQQRNAAATDYERQRRNFNEQAMMSGLATGVGSQAALAQNAAYQRQQGAINAAEGSDVSGLERSIADLKIRYQSDINNAVADNDYKRAAALLDEYNAAYSRANQEAQIKAQYGDFSGYEAMFGPETARQMQSVWAQQNPGIAYSLGYIDANTYYTLTGRYPAGYSDGNSNGDNGNVNGDDKDKLLNLLGDGETGGAGNGSGAVGVKGEGRTRDETNFLSVGGNVSYENPELIPLNPSATTNAAHSNINNPDWLSVVAGDGTAMPIGNPLVPWSDRNG